MAALLETVVSWRAFLLVLIVFGFAPGCCLRLIVLAYPRSNPRRAELIAELYFVPRIHRPLWVAEQLEIALSEGLRHRISAALRQLSHRRRAPVEADDPAAKRRELLVHGVSVMFGVSVLGADPAVQRPVPSQIGMTDVERVEAVIRAMRALGYQFNRGAVRDAVGAQLSWAQRLLSASCQEEVRQRLLRALADLQSLAGPDRFDDER